MADSVRHPTEEDQVRYISYGAGCEVPLSNMAPESDDNAKQILKRRMQQ